MVLNNKSINRNSIRVLLLAYACNPYHGSEPSIGWQWSIEVSKSFEVWTICEEKESKNDIKKFLELNGHIKNLHFVFVPKSRFESLLQRVTGLYYVGYNLWHRRAFRIAKILNKNLHFNLVHQINISGFREPGYLWKLNVPFIWGPVGGTQNYPWRFLVKEGIKGAIIEGLRSLLNIVQLRFSPRVRKAANRASVLLVANSTCKWDFEKAHNVNPVLMIETGVSEVTDDELPGRKYSGPLKILWSGVFERRKALHLLINALCRLPESIKYELRILGEGAMEKRWRMLTKNTGVEIHTKWMGWLPREKAIEQFDWADIFVFTSMRDTTGNVVLESLSKGVPVICPDHQGVGDIINQNCGIKIPINNPDRMIFQLTKIIISIANNRYQLNNLSKGAKKRARDFLWSRNGQNLAKIYKNVLTDKALRE